MHTIRAQNPEFDRKDWAIVTPGIKKPLLQILSREITKEDFKKLKEIKVGFSCQT